MMQQNVGELKRRPEENPYGFFERKMEELRPIFTKRAADYLKQLDKRIGAPIQDIAEDAVQNAMIRISNVLRSDSEEKPARESFESYFWTAVQRRCIDHFREIKRRKEVLAGGATEMAYGLEDGTHTVNNFLQPSESQRPDRRKPDSAQSAWSYAMEGQNPFTGAEGFKRPEKMSEQDFARGIEVIRGYMFDTDALSIAQRLQNLDLLSREEYDLATPEGQKRAVQVVWQAYGRMMTHLRTSMRRDGFMRDLKAVS